MRFSQHRGEVDGRRVDDNEIRRILKDSDDVEERRAAWEAAKTVGAAVAEDVRELARLRNAAAHSLGYRDWFALSVATSEMDEDKLMATLDEADRATAEPFARWKAGLDDRLATRFGCPAADLQPWHYADAFFQEVPPEGGVDLDGFLENEDLVEISRRTYDGIGLDTRTVLDRSDLFPRDGKCQHAFCIDVDRAGDIRVLANVVPSQQWADTMLHELGHATFDAGLDPSLPWLLRDTHLVVTEGIAILMGRLASDAEWLRQVVGVDPATVAGIADSLRAWRAAEMLVFTRWVLVMTNFERSLYADPECRSRCALVGARRALPARGAAARAQGPGLGREDPRGLRAGLLPHVPLRQHRRVAACGDPRARVWRPCRPPRGRPPAGRTRLRARPLGALGPVDRAGDGRAVEHLALRSRHRRRLSRVRVPGTLNHVSVVATDLEASKRFYVDELGLEPLPTPNFGFPVVWLRAGDCQLHLFERPDAPPSHAHFGLEIDEFMPVYRRMKALGVLDHDTFGTAVRELPERWRPDVRARSGRQPGRARSSRRVDDPPRRGARVPHASPTRIRRKARRHGRPSGTSEKAVGAGFSPAPTQIYRTFAREPRGRGAPPQQGRPALPGVIRYA